MTTIIPWGITYYEEVRVNVTLPAYICPRERHVTSTSRHAQHQRQLQVHLNAIRQRHVTSRRRRQSSAFGHVNVTSTSRQRHVTTSTRTASTSACHSSTSRHVSVTSRRHRQSQVHLNAIRQRRVTSASRHGVVANHLPSATSTSRQRQRPHRHDRHVAGPIRGPYSFNTAPMKTCNDHDLLETLSSSVPAGGLHVMPHHLCELGSMGLPSQMAFDSLSSLCI